jgi:hypothetical protein
MLAIILPSPPPRLLVPQEHFPLVVQIVLIQPSGLVYSPSNNFKLSGHYLTIRRLMTLHRRIVAKRFKDKIRTASAWLR